MKNKFKWSLFLLSFFLIFTVLSSTTHAQELPNTTLLYLQRGQAVREVQSALNKLGYNLATDGSYGPSTRGAVLDFQKKYSSLRNDGSYGPNTRSFLVKVLNNDDDNNSGDNDYKLPNTTLLYLQRGQAVKEVQGALNKLGYNLATDGSYGPSTRSIMLETLNNGGGNNSGGGNPSGKVAYLTFDDGPSKTVTPKILNILNDYNIKATFFILGNMAEDSPELIKKIKANGHSIGNHTYSHKYDYIYASLNNFLGEINQTENILKNILGNDFKTNLLRMPGGSFGSDRAPYKQAAIDRGYRVVDWDALNGDAEGKHVPVNQLISRLKETVKGQKEVVVLMHDAYGKETTTQALPSIIKYLKNQGYSFKPLAE
ncbi:MAG: polysaccharide deacetylase family protein [Tissierella sp.]|uniref:polysaccharide deacetylase family protein n=1 Tax=Tissierella sp. TaxID=41274 RepID=UPI003F9992AA